MSVNKRVKKIVLDEEKEAEKLLLNPPKELTFKKIYLLCKYYYKQGFKEAGVRKKILEYCNKVEFYNAIIHSEFIDHAIRLGKIHHIKLSNIKIQITKNEIEKIKYLPHKYYKLSLYMLFISKFDKYQTFSKNKNKPKNFKTYINYDLETLAYNLKINYTKRELFDVGKDLHSLGIISPTLYSSNCWIIDFVDMEDKRIEFVLHSNLDFLEQIPYYCMKCGKKINKSKHHDFCSECYNIKRREQKTELQRKYRVDSLTLE